MFMSVIGVTTVGPGPRPHSGWDRSWICAKPLSSLWGGEVGEGMGWVGGLGSMRIYERSSKQTVLLLETFFS